MRVSLARLWHVAVQLLSGSSAVAAAKLLCVTQVDVDAVKLLCMFYFLSFHFCTWPCAPSESTAPPADLSKRDSHVDVRILACKPVTQCVPDRHQVQKLKELAAAQTCYQLT